MPCDYLKMLKQPGCYITPQFKILFAWLKPLSTHQNYGKNQVFGEKKGQNYLKTSILCLLSKSSGVLGGQGKFCQISYPRN